MAFTFSIKKWLLFFLLMPFICVNAQQPANVLDNSIRSVKLFRAGDQASYPVLTLNGNDFLQLTFDDLDGDVKNYYYSYELCNADWTPTLLNTFEYIKGFQNVRLSSYRQSSIAFTRYTNYQATIPDRNCIPSHSGNYLLKVFLNGDTSQLVFTQRFLVVDNKTNISARVQQPFNAQWFNSYQKLNVIVTTDNRTRVLTPQDLKVVILQNYIWPTSLFLERPTIYRGNYFEYSDEASTAMPAGKEWRWIDLRSLRLMSERMVRMDKKSTSTDVIVKPDGERQQQPYVYYWDINGMYTIENRDNSNPFWQSDYADVYFSYYPPGNRPYEGKSIYLFGELTGYATDESSKMIFNAEKGAYEKVLFLKQGFYNYSYVTVPDNKSEGDKISYEPTEGNYWNTENEYAVLVYYRPFGARADELIGYAQVNSLPAKPGY
ncbi:MAG TPA: DUF5103 domain-containing protein [Chitinophagaceae bacterium]